jgi:hypothetical protein
MASAAPTLSGLRPLARVEATCTGTGISTGWPFGKVRFRAVRIEKDAPLGITGEAPEPTPH